METNRREILRDQIQNVLKTVIQEYGIKGDDAITIRTIKLFAVGEILHELGFNWDFIHKIFKSHTPVHPKIAQDLTSMLKPNEEETSFALSQIFVRNEKLVRLIKNLAHGGKNVDEILAVDGLAGNITNGPNFEHKHYVSNLRHPYKNNSAFIFNFEEDSEFKRLHVQTVREMYRMMESNVVENPPKHVYDILRKCISQTIGVQLPEIKFDDNETLDGALEGQIAKMYMSAMGKERMSKLIKSLRLRGDKRPSTEMEMEHEPVEKR